MSKHKILIVEDDPDTRRLFTVRLQASGYETSLAEDTYMAVSMALKEQPDLILLDLGLPAGGGLTVLERLQAQTSTAIIPVIVASASERSIHELRARKAGAVTYLQKPIETSELLAAIQHALRE